VLIAIAVVAVALALWLGSRVFVAYDALVNAQSRVADARTALSTLSATPLPYISDDLASDLETARAMTSDPVWVAAEAVPVLGDNLGAVRRLTSVLDDLVDNGLVPLASDPDLLSVDALRPVDGAIDMARVSALRSHLSQAIDAVDAAADQVEAIPLDGTVGPVRSGLTTVKAQFADLAASTGEARRVLDLLPALLGADAPRSYAIVLLDSATDASIGGAASAVVIAGLDEGRITIGEPIEVARLGIDPAALADAERDADFPAFAELIRGGLDRSGSSVDSVIGLDAVGEASLAKVAGVDFSATAGAGGADAGEAGRTLATILQRMAVGDGASQRYLRAGVLLRDEKRLSIWSAHPDEQSILARTPLSGTFSDADDKVVTYGLVVNAPPGDRSAPELTFHIELTAGACRPGGGEVAAELTNSSSTRLTRELLAVAPLGSGVSAVTVNGADVTGESAHVGSRSAERIPLAIPAHSVAEVLVTFAPSPSAAMVSELRTNARSATTGLTIVPCN
jgi:hypothetical protein